MKYVQPVGGAVNDPYVDANPGSGIEGSAVPAAALEHPMRELVALISDAGLAPTDADLTQVAKAVRTMSSGLVGAMRNGVMSVSAASATATFTADEIVVETALGGVAYRLSNFNKTINLATIGAGGMNAGAAPVSGYVALYAIYNPTTQASALLAVNATAAAQPNICGGGNLPAGYTASALVSVWATNSSGQLKIGYQRDRNIFFPSVTVLASSAIVGSLTSLNIASAVPKNAVSWSGSAIMVSTTTSSVAISISADANNTGSEYFNGNAVPGGAVSAPIANAPLITAQTAYYTTSSTAGTPTFTIYVSGYTF